MFREAACFVGVAVIEIYSTLEPATSVPIANGCLMGHFINKFNYYQVIKQTTIRISIPPMVMLEPFSL